MTSDRHPLRGRTHALRAALYARYSSEVQSSASIEDQLRVCRARADREGWTIVETFTDAAISGATTLRPGYQALLGAMREGTVDLVLTESLDRFSRDLEHIAAFHKQAVFAGVRVVTLAEGEVSELAVGLKGTMGALYLRDLADKTRRGEEGRIRQGRAIGKACYGYRMVRRLDADGEPERGLRKIDPIEAAVVRRIFRDYAAGHSPLRIARALNGEGVPAPAGRCWYATTIRGTPRFGGGILRNPIYRGQLVWNRSTSMRDPLTGKSVRRPNPEATIVTAEVPTLRIVDEQTWQAAQARLAAEAVGLAPGVERFCDRRRPRHLLSGKVFCGTCGGPFYSKGKDYLACHNARHRACTNRRPVRRPRLEAAVLDALARQIMAPDLVEVFVNAYRAAWTRLVAEQSTALDAKQRELLAIERQIENLIDAIADGLRAPGLQARLDALQARQATLTTEIDAGRATIPQLHPSLAATYRAHLARLREHLKDPDATEALEAARALIDRVVITSPEHDGDPPAIELVGDLNRIIAAAAAEPARASPPAPDATRHPVLATFISSVKECTGRSVLPPPVSY